MSVNEEIKLHVPLEINNIVLLDDAVHVEDEDEENIQQQQQAQHKQQSANQEQNEQPHQEQSATEEQHPVDQHLLGINDDYSEQEHQQQAPPWSAARIACEIFFAPCTLATCIVAGPFMFPDLFQNEYERDACDKLCCPLKLVMYPLFCCCIAFPTMGLADPNIDYFSSCNMFLIYRCPAFVYCCICCPKFPMDMRFMKNNGGK